MVFWIKTCPQSPHPRFRITLSPLYNLSFSHTHTPLTLSLSHTTHTPQSRSLILFVDPNLSSLFIIFLFLFQNYNSGKRRRRRHRHAADDHCYTTTTEMCRLVTNIIIGISPDNQRARFYKESETYEILF